MSTATRAEHARILAKEFEQDQRFVIDDNGDRCLKTLNIVNRVFLHGNRPPQVATSLAPRDEASEQTKAPTKKRSKKQDNNETWEQDAGNVSVPEIAEDARQPSAPPDKIDATADDAEQMTIPRAKKEGTREDDATSDMEDIIDVNLDGEQDSFAQ